MTLDELRAEINQDVIIRPLELDIASLDIALITSKYLIYRTDENLIVKALERNFKVLYKEKWEYWTGKAPKSVYVTKPQPLTILRSDVSTYTDADPELLELQAKIDIKKEKIKLIDSFIQIMNQRSFNISSAIKWQEFTAGK